MKFDIASLKGMKVTVMGLGLNGGGLASTRFFASHGAVVTATDLRPETQLRPTIEALSGLDIRYVLGRHEIEDFTKADLVIKNPAIKRDSPFLQAAVHIETDISVFLKLNTRPLLAVTGSKGKSTTVSALHHALRSSWQQSDLGGNITVSPLGFLDKTGSDPVVLELSSWQLADLPDPAVLDPQIVALTNIMHDHMNHYSSFEEYANDKRLIFKHQSPEHYTFCNHDDSYGQAFYRETPARPLYFSGSELPNKEDGAWLDSQHQGWLRTASGISRILDSEIAIRGEHNRKNLLLAAAMASLYGMDPDQVKNSLKGFAGIPHRMELVRIHNSISFINDSAATIPQAMFEALGSCKPGTHLICGGTDKESDYRGTPQALKRHHIYLLAGSASEIMARDLTAAGQAFHGPYDSLEAAFQKALDAVKPGDTLLLSPGAASFGMFLNEFDRGRRFQDLVKAL